MKHRIISLLLMLVPMVAMAQSWGTVTSQPSVYYFGEGWGDTAEEADREALQNLLSQIKLNISVQQSQKDVHQSKNGEIIADNTLFESTFSSYGQATLENTVRIDLDQKPRPHVGRWIRRDDVEKIWASRRQKIHQMIQSAEQAKAKGKVDVVLRNYYWALALLRTMQRSGSEEYQGHTLMPWLREQIDDVLTDVNVTAVERNGDNVTLRFTYQGKPATSFDFRYNDGGYLSGICSGRDGLGLMELTPGDNPAFYDVQMEMAYKGQTSHDPELQSVMAVTDQIPFAKARFKVKPVGAASTAPAVAEAAVTPPMPSSASFTSVNPEIFKLPEETKSSATLDKPVEEIIAAIRSRKPADVRQLFDEETYASFSRLVRHGSPTIMGTPTPAFMPIGSDTWVRGITLNFHFQNGVRKNFTEELVLTFGPDGKVINISYGLGKTAEDDILGRSVYPENVRKILVDFIQNYQTAFALKRLDYIEKIFDDNALIIVGKVLKNHTNAALTDGIRQVAGESYQYNRLTKQQYINNLRSCFASNEYVNLRFNHIQVKKARHGGEIYGIQLEQDYYSSNYSDHGYLFLEVNLNNPAEPLILVRTWQPKPDPDFGLYDITSFPIY